MKRHLKKTVNENVLKEVRNENDLFIPRADQDEHLQDQFIVQLKVRRKFDQVDLKEIACIYMKDESVVIIALNEKQIGIYSITLDHMKTLITEKGLKNNFFFHRSFILAYVFFDYPNLKISIKEIITRLNQIPINYSKRTIIALRSVLNRLRKINLSE